MHEERWETRKFHIVAMSIAVSQQFKFRGRVSYIVARKVARTSEFLSKHIESRPRSRTCTLLERIIAVALRNKDASQSFSFSIKGSLTREC